MNFLQKTKSINENLAIIYSQIKKSNIDTLPTQITLTMTLRCNYRCKMCYQNTFSGDMDRKILKKIEDIMPFARSVQAFGGEPLAYPHLDEVIDFSRKYETELHTITNGSLITEGMARDLVASGFRHMKVSIDAGTPQTYKQIRGGNFFEVIGGVARITREKLRLDTPYPNIHINFLAMKSNILELPKLVVIAAEIGVTDVNVFFPSLHKEELLHECLYFHQEESDITMLKAREIGKELGVNVRLPQLFSEEPDKHDKRFNCADPWTKFLIDVNGDATLCCGGAPILGNILESSMDDIWNGEIAQNIRKTVNTDKEPPYCKICRLRKPSTKELGMHIPTHLHKLACAMH
jgi:MoaA/NifB/PqqE/SkfB family radical SAM enzyme